MNTQSNPAFLYSHMNISRTMKESIKSMRNGLKFFFSFLCAKNKKKNERKRVKWQRCQLSCMPEYDPFVCDSLQKHLAKLKQFLRPFFLCVPRSAALFWIQKVLLPLLLHRNPNPTIFILNKNQEKSRKKGSCIIM